MRKTKIICTIGPASESEEKLREIMLAGMNVARFNFSHGSHEEHKRKYDRIKKLRDELELPVAVMLDTKGPEIRLKDFENGKEELVTGQRFTLTSRDILGTREEVAITYKELTNDCKEGMTILLDDGLIELRVDEVSATDIVCTVINGGPISDKKGVNVPGAELTMPYLSEQDRSDIEFGCEQGFDYVAASFVRTKEDVMAIREILKAKNSQMKIIAKIESTQGINNLKSILQEADGIMVARGDMGVEVPFEQLPAIQKDLITKCRMLGKRVITATEMLESMIHNPRPTRAETSDVANAVYDGTSAIMLSGETAAGAYPVQAVETMAKIAETTEQNIHYNKRFYNYDFIIKNDVDAISHATCGMAIDLDAKAIVACTLSGRTARMVSRFRSPVDIIGLTTNEKTWRWLSLSWAVTPKMCDVFPSTDVLFYSAKKVAIETFDLKEGDKIVITGGVTNGESGNTNLIKIEDV